QSRLDRRSRYRTRHARADAALDRPPTRRSPAQFAPAAGGCKGFEYRRQNMSGPMLGVNIDHVATLRQARRGHYPSVIQAALVAEQAGADAITIHLREDRRHIQDEDVRL